MPVAVNSVVPVIAAQGVAADVVLQPGTVIDARVLKLLANDFVRIALSNLSIEVLSEVPLQVGQALQLSVSQTADGVRLQIVPQGAGDPNVESSAGDKSSASGAPAARVAASDTASLQTTANARVTRPLTNLEALAVSAAVQAAAARQGGLSPLFANLAVAASSQTLPHDLQQASAQLLMGRPALDESLSGGVVKTAFQQSGLFLEQTQRLSATGTAQAAASAPDLKAALIVFKQMLTSWLGDGAGTAEEAPLHPPGAFVQQGQARAQADTAATLRAPSLAPQIDIDEVLLPQSALLLAEDAEVNGKLPNTTQGTALATMARAAAADTGLASMQEMLQGFPKGVREAVQTLLAAQTPLKGDTGIKDGLPPPFRGAAPSAQAVASPAFAVDTSPDHVAHRLLSDTDAALARQTLLQVASLPERVDQQGVRLETNVPRWNFEIPFATPQGTAVAQFEISRDGEGVEATAASRVWRARFSLNVEPAGPVHALVSLVGERTSVRMWAERANTAAQLRANTPQLTQALREAELTPGDIVIGEGAGPTAASSPPQGHFLDRAL